MRIIQNKKMKQGAMFGIFVVLYSVFRFITEFFRAADAQVGYFGIFTMGQILSILMFAAGSIFIGSFAKAFWPLYSAVTLSK